MKRASVGLGVAAALAAVTISTRAAATLDVYVIDVEGGQSTLIVTPAGESLLVDAGFPADGTFQSRAGDAAKARDPNRIAAVARMAGLSRIDYLVVTHFHADHMGGVAELSKLIPIGAFVDHDTVRPEAEARVPGTMAIMESYAAARATGRHIIARPDDRLALKGVDLRIVSSAGAVITKPLPGGGRSNAACAAGAVAAEEPTENPRSTGFRLRFGRFTFLDLGDLSGEPLHALACPKNLTGPVDVYLVAHHGGIDSADPATLTAFGPRAAILNNGATKGGAPETFALLHRTKQDVWQLHRSTRQGVENFSDERIANLDESTAHWLKVSASTDGSFTVTNGRTGTQKIYGRR